MKNFKTTLLIISILITPKISYAGTTTWEWDLAPGSDGNTTTSCKKNCPTNEIVVSQTQGKQSATISVTAWADTREANIEGMSNSDPLITQSSMPYFSKNKFNDSTLGGWGAVNKDETLKKEHAFDNKGKGKSTDYDMALVSFDTSIELTDVGLGWVHGDAEGDGADFSVLAYQGAGAPILKDNYWDNMLSSGDWIVVGNYERGRDKKGTGYLTDYYSINSTGISSQYWLIGAYNNTFKDQGETKGTMNEGDDEFKIRKFKGKSTDSPAEEVSAPASFSLLLLGMILLGIRYKKSILVNLSK